MRDQAPVDPGLQPERTELAWRRTALAIAIGSLLSLRVLPTSLPPAVQAWGLVPGLIGLLAACGIWLAAHRRQVIVSAFLNDPARASTGGRLIFTLTSLVCSFGVTALIFVAVSAVG